MLASAFHQVLELAGRAEVLKVGDTTVSVDGTKILANASKHSAVGYDHAVEQMKLAEKPPAYLYRSRHLELWAMLRECRRAENLMCCVFSSAFETS